MTHLQKIVAYLQGCRSGVDDDDLAFACGIHPRQQVNAICRTLAKAGVIERRKVRGKIQNFWIDQPPIKKTKSPTPSAKTAEEA